VKVAVALALARRQAVVELELEEGATVREAVSASGLAGRFPELDLGRLTPGICSRACGWDAKLRDGDRVELYRPLQADAKQMRRLRARKP
jgi:hypothetical protein